MITIQINREIRLVTAFPTRLLCPVPLPTPTVDQNSHSNICADIPAGLPFEYPLIFVFTERSLYTAAPEEVGIVSILGAWANQFFPTFQTKTNMGIWFIIPGGVPFSFRQVMLRGFHCNLPGSYCVRPELLNNRRGYSLTPNVKTGCIHETSNITGIQFIS